MVVWPPRERPIPCRGVPPLRRPHAGAPGRPRCPAPGRASRRRCPERGSSASGRAGNQARGPLRSAPQGSSPTAPQASSGGTVCRRSTICRTPRAGPARGSRSGRSETHAVEHPPMVGPLTPVPRSNTPDERLGKRPLRVRHQTPRRCHHPARPQSGSVDHVSTIRGKVLSTRPSPPEPRKLLQGRTLHRRGRFCCRGEPGEPGRVDHLRTLYVASISI